MTDAEERRAEVLARAREAIARADEALTRPRPPEELRDAWKAPEAPPAVVHKVRQDARLEAPKKPTPALSKRHFDIYRDELEKALGKLFGEHRGEDHVLRLRLVEAERRIGELEAKLAEAGR